MKKKMVLVFSLMLTALLLFQSCGIAIEQAEAIPSTTEVETTVETTIETTELETTSSTEESTEVILETIKEILPVSMDTTIVAAEMASRSGMIGRLIIPFLGVDVALFNRYTQGVVDRQDSAGTYRYNGGQMVIADHKNQGFSATKASVPNETIAFINDGQTIKPYICVENNVGSNKSNGIPYDLLDCNGESIYLQNEGGLCMYTCNHHWSSITYTYWQPIE